MLLARPRREDPLEIAEGNCGREGRRYAIVTCVVGVDVDRGSLRYCASAEDMMARYRLQLAQSWWRRIKERSWNSGKGIRHKDKTTKHPPNRIPRAFAYVQSIVAINKHSQASQFAQTSTKRDV